MAPVSSPCIRVCILDEATGLCLGCGRTSTEITRWWRMSEEQRLSIMAGLAARLQQLAERESDKDARPCPE